MGHAGIEHVIVLMLENRSFDQMLGCMPGVEEGVSRENCNDDSQGNRFEQIPGAEDDFAHDPPHGLRSVLAQIGAGEPKRAPEAPRDYLAWLRQVRHTYSSLIPVIKEAWENREKLFRAAGREMDGFVEEFVKEHPNSTHEERQQVMSYFSLGSLPALHKLAQNFTVCERWFSSVPGPTWANRFFLHSGTAAGSTWMPHDMESLLDLTLMFNQRTIYDELAEKNKSWRIYYHDVPQVLALAAVQRLATKRNVVKFVDQWESDLNSADFPAFTVIEPAYFDYVCIGNDDHPPHDTQETQKLIAHVYNSLRSSPIWEKSLLVITYDEHGGFYDHVPPPEVIPPDQLQDEYDFDRYGVRVPAILVSPFARKSFYRETLDHTSIGAFLVEQFGINPLTARMDQAHSFSDALTTGLRDDTPLKIPTEPEPADDKLSPGLRERFRRGRERREARRVKWNGQVAAMQSAPTEEPRGENQLALKALADALAQQATRRYGATSGPHALAAATENPHYQVLRFLESKEE